MRSSLYTAVALSALVSSPLMAQDNSRLFGSDDGKSVKLQWHPKAWAADQVGYMVKRRAAGTAAWQPLTPVCRPSLNPARDGKTVGMNAEQAAAFAEWNKTSQALATVPEEQMRRVLLENKGVPLGNRIEMSKEGNRAFALNLGYMDNTRPDAGSYEYGLFVVREGDKVDAEPVHTCRPFTAAERRDWPKVTGLKVKQIVYPNCLALVWRMPAGEARRLSVDSFTVKRRLANETEWETVLEGVPYSMRKQDALWTVSDKKSLQAGPRMYRLIPSDMFGTEYPALEYKVDHVEYLPPTAVNVGPRELKLSGIPSGVSVTWKQPVEEYEEYSVSGFRLQDVFDAKKVIAETSDPKITEFKLKEEQLKTMTSMYRVFVLFEDENGQKMSVNSTDSFDHAELQRAKNPPPSVPKP